MCVVVCVCICVLVYKYINIYTCVDVYVDVAAYITVYVGKYDLVQYSALRVTMCIRVCTLAVGTRVCAVQNRLSFEPASPCKYKGDCL